MVKYCFVNYILVEIKLTKEELDTVNERADELDEIIKDGINCVNGR